MILRIVLVLAIVLTTDAVSLTVNALPVVDAGSDIAMCVNAGLQILSGAPIGGTWTGVGITNSSGDFDPNVAGVGIHTLYYSYTDINACSNIDSMIVTVFDLPIVYAGNDTTLCNQAGAIQFTGTPIGGSWSGTHINSSGGFDPNGVGLFENVYSYTATNGCTNSDTMYIDVISPASINAGADLSVCEDTNAVQLNGIPAGGVWTGNGISNGGLYTLTGIGSFDFMYTSGTGNCLATDTVNLNVVPLPTIDAGADASACIGESIALFGSGGVSYTWDNGVTDGVSFNPTTNLQYTVTGTDAIGCTNTDSVWVNINMLPGIYAGADQVICYKDSIALSATPASWTYTWDNGITDGVYFSPSFTNTYTVAYTDANGCTSTDSLTIYVNQLPAINGGADVNVCIADSVTLTASGGGIYVWNNGISNGVPFYVNNNMTCIVAVTATTGCSNSDTVQIITYPLPTVYAGADTAVCVGGQVTLNGSGAVTYSWNNGITNGVPFTANSSLTYTVIGADVNGCENIDDVYIEAYPLPNVIAGQEQFVCIGEQVTLFASGASNYVWDNGVSDGVAFIPAATSTYNVIGTDVNSCENTDQTSVTVYELPEMIETVIHENYGNDGAVSIDVISGGSPYLFDWDIDGFGDNDDEQDLTELTGGTYTVVVTDSYDCSDTLTVIVESMTQLIIPSALTPNSDGFNDVWDIIGLHNYPNMQLQIFNRWGQLIHEQKGQYTYWDGTYNGKRVPVADYFYVITLGTEEEPHKGTVTVKY